MAKTTLTLRIDTGLEIFFCDRSEPWQSRGGSNEKTPTGAAAAVASQKVLIVVPNHSRNELDCAVALALNHAHAKTLGGDPC